MEIIIAISMVGVAAVLAAIQVARLFSNTKLPVTAEWIEELSIERYRTMLRLLNPEDLRFLREQPGTTWWMENRFRGQRCRLFRTYLRDMESDFKRICAALQVVMVQSKLDRPDLSSALLRKRLTFAWRMTVVEWQVAMFRLGIGRVNVSALVNQFNGLRLELHNLIPAPARLAA